MPTNANVFNSRVTSEALEAKFRQVFPAQGGAELVQDLFASGVIQPVVDFSSVAEGSVLAPNLQTAWDLASGFAVQKNVGSTTAINNTGFWKISAVGEVNFSVSGDRAGNIFIDDGVTSSPIWVVPDFSGNFSESFITQFEGVVFLKTGESLTLNSEQNMRISISYRQIADLNGTLVNPLGFTFS